jgi:hypothetical protein
MEGICAAKQQSLTTHTTKRCKNILIMSISTSYEPTIKAYTQNVNKGLTVNRLAAS